MRRSSNAWSVRSQQGAQTTMSSHARGRTSKSFEIRQRRHQGDRLKIFQLELQAVAVAVLRLLDGMRHQFVDQLLRSFGCL